MVCRLKWRWVEHTESATTDEARECCTGTSATRWADDISAVALVTWPLYNGETPPRPPDPPDRVSSLVESMEFSPLVFPQPGVKRRLDNVNECLAEPFKKAMTDVRPSADDVNPGFYSHPSLTDSPKSYHINDKGPFLVHFSCPESNPSSGSSIRSIKFGHFLINKYPILFKMVLRKWVVTEYLLSLSRA
ncbi:unnamed protein product [Pieris brassicae]|uniref:Uncharacterized protein n=1 Tax=Pieris brassicae TaxID=7116 RepID=A0A9P0SMN5_PIEBR|nr:unnamed protein product [Pieris brassicae]